MNNFLVPIVYVAFFGLIAFAVYYTNSAQPLWALLLTPSVRWKKGKKKDNKKTIL